MDALLALANIPLAQIETEAARLLGAGLAMGWERLAPASASAYWGPPR